MSTSKTYRCIKSYYKSTRYSMRVPRITRKWSSNKKQNITPSGVLMSERAPYILFFHFSIMPETPEVPEGPEVAGTENVSGPDITGVQAEVAGQTPLTFGQKAVWVSFNPSGAVEVAHAKNLCAELINLLGLPPDQTPGGPRDSWIRNVLRTAAFNAVIAAQMAVVKFLTWTE